MCMGRGLSGLQKYILKTAAETPGDWKPPGRLYNFEICEGFYGWKAGKISPGVIPKECDHVWTSTGGKWPQWKCDKCGLMIQPADRAHMCAYAGKNFESSVVGKKKYNAVQVAIHKAVDRLEKRGLAERIGNDMWKGVAITEEGMEVVAGWDKVCTA